MPCKAQWYYSKLLVWPHLLPLSLLFTLIETSWPLFCSSNMSGVLLAALHGPLPHFSLLLHLYSKVNVCIKQDFSHQHKIIPPFSPHCSLSPYIVNIRAPEHTHHTHTHTHRAFVYYATNHHLEKLKCKESRTVNEHFIPVTWFYPLQCVFSKNKDIPFK